VQWHNAAVVAALPSMFTARDRAELRDSGLLAVEAVRLGVRSTGRRGKLDLTGLFPVRN
jgi:hypothetical protein